MGVSRRRPGLQGAPAASSSQSVSLPTPRAVGVTSSCLQVEGVRVPRLWPYLRCSLGFRSQERRWWCGAPLPSPTPRRDCTGWVGGCPVSLVQTLGMALGEPARDVRPWVHPVLVGEPGTQISIEQVKNCLERKGEGERGKGKKGGIVPVPSSPTPVPNSHGPLAFPSG